jgi:phosphohistidine swiveling domain-containing protein
MQKKRIQSILDSGEWIHFVSKPFSLFSVSVWQICYEEYLPQITRGVFSMHEGIFIKEKNGMVRSYRRPKDLDMLKSVLFQIYSEDREYVIGLLDRARQTNIAAEQALCCADDLDLKEAVDLACRCAVFGAILPRFLSGALVERGIFDNEILDRCIELKKVSCYPNVLENIVIPSMRRSLSETGLESLIDVVTMQEALSNDFSEAGKRYELVKGGNTFMVCDIGNVKDIFWTKDPDQYISYVEKTNSIGNQTVFTGKTLYPGKIEGVAKVCLSMNGSDLDNFQSGDILITSDSNPNIRHLMTNAGAVIVEEAIGMHEPEDLSPGIFGFKNNQKHISHASVICTELGIPCIVGVKNISRSVRSGQRVKVNATKGSVEILSAY